MSDVSPETGPEIVDETAGGLPPLPSEPRSRRVRKAIGPVLLACSSGSMAVWPTGVGVQHPAVRALQACFALGFVVITIGQLRLRVLLERDGLVIRRLVRRTRIPWAEVRDVRIRGLSMGRGWIEVVRQDSREVVLPTPVEAYPLLKEQWERSTRGLR
ncbi:hypothetical protein GCM10009868_25590 [Terrabacter aerolatus]|uniref:Low molecular weight protein antigen 6 PH domain-containing protein n=3 Tax=Terrabacter aerolatus TaxID=422442 RepID=A0A512D6V9_9MICO|nr:hypothetical protein TAE01_39170 [Terrabacter aerolatus]